MSSPEAKSESDKSGKRRPFQFRLITLMVVMLLCSVFAALFGGLLRTSTETSAFKVRFVLLTLLVPVGLVMVIALVRFLTAPRKKRRRPWD